MSGASLNPEILIHREEIGDLVFVLDPGEELSNYSRIFDRLRCPLGSVQRYELNNQ